MAPGNWFHGHERTVRGDMTAVKAGDLYEGSMG